MNKEGIASKEELTAKITLKATDGSSEYQRVKLTYPNLPEGLRVNSTSIFLPKDKTEKVYTIKFYNQTESEILLNNVNVTVSLENVDSLLMKHEPDSEDQRTYYYVEMGTVMREDENEYIKWRYISADGTRPIGTTEPSDLNGTYILETDLATEYGSDARTYAQNKVIEGVGNGSITEEEAETAMFKYLDEYFENIYNSGVLCAFNTEVTEQDGEYYNTTYKNNGVLANDYKTSTIRKYMNYVDKTVYKQPNYEQAMSNGGTSSTANTETRASNMVIDLNIDTEQDVVYKMIKAKNLTDLYKKITNFTSNPQDKTPPQVTVEGLEDTGSDKFWLLSYYEVYNLLSSTQSMGTDTGRDWNTNSEVDDYWLRSPDSNYSDLAWLVYNDGLISGNYVFNGWLAARAAFTMSL